MSEVITFTESAKIYIGQQIQQQPNAVGFRLSIKESGCTGFAYVPEVITDIPKADKHFTLQNGLESLAIYVDPACMSCVQGMEIDYVSEGINRRLVFNNPNVVDACGCGESFSVKETVDDE